MNPVISLTALLLGTFLAMISAFAGLGAWHYGIWFQSEPIVLCTLLAGTVCILGLLLANKPQCHPLILPLIAMALLSVVIMPFSLDASSTLLGSAELGEGIAGYLVVIAFTLAGFSLADRLRSKWILLALLTLITIIVLTLVISPSWHAPFRYPDFLSFYGTTLPFILIAGLGITRLWKQLALLLLGWIIVYISENQSAILFMALGCVAYLIGKLLPFLENVAKRWGTLLIIAIPLLLTIAIMWFGDGTVGNSIWSRAKLWEVALTQLLENPLRLLTGYGWGSYHEILIRHPFVDGAQWYQVGDWKPNWDAMFMQHFHSHNILIEALFSVGLGGVVLTLLYFIAMFRYAKPEYKLLSLIYSVVMLCCLSTWFQMPLTWVFVAITPVFFVRKNVVIHVKYHRTALCGILLVLIASIYIQITNANRSQNIIQRHQSSCDVLQNTHIRSQHMLHIVFDFMAVYKTQEAPTDATQQQLNAYLCWLESRGKDSSEAAPDLLQLIIRTEQILRHHQADPQWNIVWKRFYDKSPKRTDIAGAYGLWLLQQGKEDELLKLMEAILQQQPHDPVGLWLSGVVLMNADQTAAEGLNRMKQAIEAHVERYLPISGEMIQKVKAL